MIIIFESEQYNVIRKDPFAALAETLKTNQRASCDGDVLHMECPTGTKISIQLVMYGRSAPSATVCPPTPMQPRIFTGNDGFTCTIREALRTVEELCQSKQSCSIITSPTSFGVSLYDPCPGVRKYVEVAYKCRPTRFSSRMICGGESLSLTCNEPLQNIAIFSSTFQSAGTGPIYCPVRREFIEEALDYSKDEAGRSMKECERSDISPTIMSKCHGRKTCNITADPLQLNAPACDKQHVLLKITYACMSGQNFLPKFVSTEKPMSDSKTKVMDTYTDMLDDVKNPTQASTTTSEASIIDSPEKIFPVEKENTEESWVLNMDLIFKIISSLQQNFIAI